LQEPQTPQRMAYLQVCRHPHGWLAVLLAPAEAVAAPRQPAVCLLAEDEINNVLSYLTSRPQHQQQQRHPQQPKPGAQLLVRADDPREAAEEVPARAAAAGAKPLVQLPTSQMEGPTGARYLMTSLLLANPGADWCM